MTYDLLSKEERMRGVILLALIFHLWLNSTNAKHVIQYFLEVKAYDHLVICDLSLNDEIIETLKNHVYEYQVYLEKWNCFNEVNKINTGLVFLHNPEPILVANLLNQSGSQKSLSSNTLLIIQSIRETLSVIDYFSKNELRIGLNAKIFIAKPSEIDIFLYQALGVGTVIPQIKVNSVNSS